jgi:sorting nexin-4
MFMRFVGKTGLMSRLFGSVDTEEVREMKVNLLEQKIQEGKISVYSAQTDLRCVEILACFLCF